jgi:hypothetical protein
VEVDTMNSVQLRTQVNAQGQVMVTLPPDMAGREVDLVVAFAPTGRPLPVDPSAPAPAWPADFFDATVGSLPAFPDIDAEGDYERRDPLA